MNKQYEDHWNNGIKLLLIFLTIIGLSFFLWNLIMYGPTLKERQYFQVYSKTFFLLISLTLFLNILIETRRAFREWAESRETPPLKKFGQLQQSRYRMKGSPQPLIQHCVETLEKDYKRFYSFHKYQSPHMFYYYLAKKGSSSLFIRPWIKTGFFLFFLLCYAYTSKIIYFSMFWWTVIVPVIALSFWIPGLLIHLLIPYQKIWLCIGQEEGNLFFTLTCQSSSHKAKLEDLYNTTNLSYLDFLKNNYSNLTPLLPSTTQ